MPDDQFQFNAERHAEFVALIAVLPGQFIAIEPRFGRQHGPAVALVAGESRPAIALIVGKSRPAVALRQLRVVFRQPGLLRAERIPVRRITRRWRLRFWRFRATPTAAATRLAYAAVHRWFAGQHAIIVRITVRRGFGRGLARHPGRFDTQWRPNWTCRLDRHRRSARSGRRTGIHGCWVRGTARVARHRRSAWSGRPTGIHERGIRGTARFGGHCRHTRPVPPARLRRR